NLRPNGDSGQLTAFGKNSKTRAVAFPPSVVRIDGPAGVGPNVATSKHRRRRIGLRIPTDTVNARLEKPALPMGDDAARGARWAVPQRRSGPRPLIAGGMGCSRQLCLDNRSFGPTCG